MKLNYQRMMAAIFFNALLAGSSFCYALPFNIFPKAPLPTQIIIGQTLTALYTVQNNTGTFRANNFIKYLPPNVTQVFSDPKYPDLCGPLFHLTARGIPGDSCTLELQISGAVRGNDPDPHHHLFICFIGGKTCAGPLNPLDVTVIPKPPAPPIHLVAVGSSSEITDIIPLGYTSIDFGANWSLSSFSAAPQINALLSSVSCVENVCTTVGQSVDGGFGNGLPLAYHSTTNGMTWTLLPAFTPPPGLPNGALNGVSCRDNMCTAVGFSSGVPALPLAYISNDSGLTWTLSTLAAPLPGPNGMLNSVSCVGLTCVAVGNSLAVNRVPLAYTSSDGGLNWVVSSAFSLPVGQPNGNLLGVSCVGSTCTAVGSSQNAGFTNTLPLVYTSIDAGNTWVLSASLSLPQSNGSLNGITCIGTSCTAVGISYNVGFTNGLPLAYTSNNSGSTWTLSSPFTLPAGITQGSLQGVTCQGTLCSAVGVSIDGFINFFPLAYTSNNSGATWTLSSPFTLPAGRTEGALNGVASGGSSIKKFGLENGINGFISNENLRTNLEL